MNAIEIGAFEAKTKFAELLARVARGQEFLITKRGRPVARLTAQENPTGVTARRTLAGRLYRKIQQSGPRLTNEELDECIRANRAELLHRGEKLAE